MTDLKGGEISKKRGCLMMLQTGDKGALGKDDTEKVGQC
jgi:hypothetical protein